jgi:predicted nuclease of predicted toxin-antitoxin system
VSSLVALGHDVDNVRIEGIEGSADDTVWQAAQEEGRFFVTQDLDFSDVRRFVPGSHHGLLLVRLRSAGRLALAAKVLAAFQTEDVAGWARCFVVLSDHKLRVHAPAE